MLYRKEFEKGLRPLFESTNLGTTSWSPICGGILAGKYNDGTAPSSSRFADDLFMKNHIWPNYFSEGKKENTIKLL